jgi:hypothetical protein
VSFAGSVCRVDGVRHPTGWKLFRGKAAKQFPIAAAGAALLVWAISVAGATGWSLTTNWALFGAGVGLLALRAVA